MCGSRLGLLDILVANAGIPGEMQIPEELDAEEWRKVFATNVDGVFHCCRAVYPIMKEIGRGKVIIMGSASSMTGSHIQAAFTSSKGAVVPFAKSLAVAWARANIQVNCILPGAVDTDFNVDLMVHLVLKYVDCYAFFVGGRSAEKANCRQYSSWASG